MKYLVFCCIIFTLIMGCKQQKKLPNINPEEQARQDSLAKVEAVRADSVRRYQEAVSERLKIEREKERISELKNTIKIISVFTSAPNSVGGVDVHTIWKNTSTKVIKYVSFYWTPYNAVGDVVSCSIRGYRDAGEQVTGPINPGQTHGYNYSWECHWYNNTIKKATLDKIEIDYMDGTTKTIESSDIEYVYKKQW
ncbi:MAG: hypothetical protein Q8M98_02320 [Candidatus Cloacimonadaceae bacterium]|nr:hypothetical protein [Candidatus Cloacimonadaceae bacterium]